MTFTDADKQLRFAIAHKRLIEIGYHHRLRVAEPHDYGIMSGGKKLLVYQLRAVGAERTRATGWRLLDMAKIETCRVLEQTFPGSRGHTSRRHMTWDEVFARVE